MTQAIAQRRTSLPTADPIETDVLKTWGFYQKFLIFALLHIPLVFAMNANRYVGTVHAVITLLVGLYFLKDEKPYRMLYVAAYIAGMEILWRGTLTLVFYEFGKYSISLLLGLSLLRQKLLQKIDVIPLFYFAVLMPSIPQAQSPHDSLNNLALIDYPFYFLNLNRTTIAFHLSGPFVLAMSAAYFSAIKFNRQQIVTLLFSLVVPIFALLVLAVQQDYLHIDQLSSIVVSSHMTAAGFGPNQVSSILGLGVMGSFLLLLLVKRFDVRIAMALLTVLLAAQNLLTFSRGGFWTGLAAVAVAALYLLRDRRQRVGAFAAMIVFVLVLNFVVLPLLTSLAGDNIVARFSSFDLEARDTIAMDEFQLFLRSPVFGMGPGSTNRYAGHAAHTEYARAIGEHGSFGLLSMLILGFMAVRRLLTGRPPTSKALMMAFTVWPMLFMLHAATRNAAPGFIFGLGAATFLLNSDRKDGTDEPSYDDQ
jgi:hypothetical protein